MSTGRFWKMGWIVILCVLGISIANAQPELDATYTSHDGSFTFLYPDQGMATVDDSHVGSVQILVPLYDQIFNINVFRPWMTQIQFSGIESLESARQLLTERMGADEETIEINTFQSHRMLEFFDMGNGFWILIELEDGAYGMVSVHDERDRRDRCQSLGRAIALSYSYQYPVIQTYDEAWETVIAELQQRHLIGEQGSLVFSQPGLLENQGELWLSDEYTAHGNVVVSARITLSGSVHCGLMAHVQQGSTADPEELFALRLTVKAQTANATIGFSDSYGVISRGFDFNHIPITEGSTHNYLLITNDNAISIYVDGSPLIEHVPIAPVAGYYGIYFTPLSTDGHCTVSDYWVYQHDPIDSGEACMALMMMDTDGRISPTADQIIRRFAEGETQQAVCHHSLENGEMWYLLQDGSWVQSGNVHLSGNCTNLTGIH